MKLRGLQGPLQRGAGDFLVLEGANYVDNVVECLLGIHANPWEGTGELEWDQDVGTMIETLRHRNITKQRLELLTLQLAEQLRTYLPGIVIRSVSFRQQAGNLNAVAVAIRWAFPRLQASGTSEVLVT